MSMFTLLSNKSLDHKLIIADHGSQLIGPHLMIEYEEDHRYLISLARRFLQLPSSMET